MTIVQFEPFPKIGRLKREIIITEKIDGTNAAIQIVPVNEAEVGQSSAVMYGGVWYGLYVQSRNRFITPQSDNYGFATWVQANAHELVKLGPGTHFGEWWGKGIQRGYGLEEKRFSLFNVARWNPQNPNKPECCSVVPTLYRGEDHSRVDHAVESLREFGSVAAPGFEKPEGIVVWHSALRTYSKVTLENDATPKSVVKEAA